MSSEKLITIAENQRKVYDTGHADGIEKRNEEVAYLNDELETTLNGGDTGKKSRYDELWLGILNGGERTILTSIFTYWNMEYIRPPIKIVATATSMSSVFSHNHSLKKVEAQYFDFSQLAKATKKAEGYYYTFYNCTALEEIEDIGLFPNSYYTYTFSNCTSLKKIAKITLDEETGFDAAFQKCTSLEEITIDGTIGQNGFNVGHSTKLNKASITSIINALSSTTSGLTVTLSKTAVNNAFTTDEWNALINTKTNWTISLI